MPVEVRSSEGLGLNPERRDRNGRLLNRAEDPAAELLYIVPDGLCCSS
jgi:hypothetical protein